MKIVINGCYGGFSVSKEAVKLMSELGCERAKKELEEAEKEGHFYGYGYVKGMDGDGYSRTSEYLVSAVESLGKSASGSCADLVVREIPEGIDYYIDEYDGIESIRENHRSW